jgi:small subunit ribosomal protein S8
MMTDPIADMLTHIRNAVAIRRRQVSMPASRMKVGIAQVLKEEGYLEDYKVEPGEPRSILTLKIKYGPDGEIVIREIARVSKPGRRVYSTVKDMPKVLRGLGVYVLSTPKGVFSDRVARQENVGGEILCKVS